MKQLTLILTLFTSLVYAQIRDDRFIEISGRAERKVEPNLIYLTIELKEYRKDKEIIQIEKLENNLLTALGEIGIDKENLTVFGTKGNLTKMKRLDPNLLITKRYILKITDFKLFGPLLDRFGDLNISSVYVKEVTHKDIETFKMETQVQAIKNAEIKARELLKGLNKNLGDVISVRETLNEYLSPAEKRALAYSVSTTKGGDKVLSTTDLAFEPLTLTYQIFVKFEIK